MHFKAKHIVLFAGMGLSTLFGYAQIDENAFIETSEQKTYFHVHNMSELNTSYSEFSPVLHKKELVFTSDREIDLINAGENRWKENPHLVMYTSDIIKTSDTINYREVRFITSLQYDNHTGPISFTANDSVAFFTRVMNAVKVKGEKVVNKPKIFQAVHHGGSWNKVSPLNFCLNNYTYEHPSITEDGKRLFFASDGEGGQGGKDIFYVEWKDSAWSQPINIKAINTGAHEVFPYYYQGALYFSSNGHPGMGGLDIFKSIETTDGWSEPKPMPEPVNSSGDDFGLSLSDDYTYGYFSSNRMGGKGGDDIYYIEIEQAVLVSNSIVGQFEYRKLQGDYPSGLKVVLVDDEGNVIYEVLTDEQGKFIFENLSPDTDYMIRIDEGSDEVVLTLFTDKNVPIQQLVNNRKGEFVYKKLNTNGVGTLALIDEEDINLTDHTAELSGQFIYETLTGDNPAGLNVYLVDDEGNIVMTALTDEYGNFIFENLPTDKNYLLKMDEGLDDVTILIYNKSGEVVAQLKPDFSGKFIYRKLNSDQLLGLALMEENDELLEFSNKSAVTGRFDYRKLGGDIPDGLKIMVFDEDGNPLFETTVDKKGHFRFTELPLDENLIFMLSEEDLNADLNLTIIDRFGNVITEINRGPNGKFVYRRLKKDQEGLTLMDEEDGSGDLADLPNDKFLYDQLALDKQKMNVQDVKDELTTIASQKPKASKEEKQEITKTSNQVFFDRNSSYLSTEGYQILGGIAQKMKDNPSLKLDIKAYADSKATEEYNLWLTERRAQRIIDYLVSRGISKDRLRGRGYGEQNLIVNCPTKDCSEEEQQKNRRAELNFVE